MLRLTNINLGLSGSKLERVYCDKPLELIGILLRKVSAIRDLVIIVTLPIKKVLAFLHILEILDQLDEDQG